MAQFKKFNSHLCVFLICQFLFSVTITNSAVIRRSISSNVTVNNEVDPGSVPTNEDIESLLLEESLVKDKTTTEKTIQSTIIDNEDMKKEATVTTQTIDENTVGLSSDSQESPKARETTTTTETMSKNEKTTMHEEMPTTTVMETTVKTNDKKIPITTDSQNQSKEHTTVSDEITNDTTIQGPEAETLQVTTLEESDSLEHTTLVDPIEDTTNAKIPVKQLAEEDSTNISTESEEETVRPPKTEDPIHVVSLSSIDLVTDMSTMKDKIGETVTEQSTAEIPTTNNLKANPKEISRDGKLMPVTTATESMLPVSDENSTIDGLTDDSKTSTVKLDETTVLLTSTENSDEEPVKDDEVKNSTPSASSEKRGKFIAHNFSSFNELHLPNTSDVWALAGLKFAGKPKQAELQENSVETSEEKPVNNSMATKSLLDWTRVMETTQGMDSETTLKSSQKDEDTTTTELPTTVLLQENEVEIASTKLEADETTVTVDMTNTSEPKLEKIVPESRTEAISATIGSVATSGSKTMETPSEITTEASVTLTDTTEAEMAVGWTDATEVKTYVSLKDTTKAKIDHEPEATTNFDDKVEGSTLNHLTTDAIALKETETAVPNTDNPAKSFNRPEDELIEENKVDGANFEKEIHSESTTTTTTTTTPIPDIVSMKSETTNSHATDGETTEEANAGTSSLSTSSLLDFTTSIPFLTSTNMTTTTTTEVPPTTPAIVFNMDDAVNESPKMTSTQIPLQSSSPSAAMDVTESIAIATTTKAATTTTTTTTMPADTFMAGTTESETQTTTEAPHTPAIITSNDTKNNNYHEYEVVNKTTEKSDDSSSTESTEATTRRRVASSSSTWSTTNIGKISTKEVDSLDFEFDTTTAPNFDENRNTFDIESTTTSTVISASGVTLAPNKTKLVTTAPSTVRIQTSTEDLDHIDPIHKISDTAETSIESNVIDPLHVGETSTKPTTSATTTTENSQENMRMQSNESVGVDSSSSTSTTTSNAIHDDDSSTTLQSISTKNEDIYSIVPTIDNGGFHVPKLVLDDATTLMPPRDLGISGIGGVGGSGGLQPMDSQDGQETDVNVIIAISVSTVGIIALILLVAFLYVMRKRQKQMSYGQRCRPVSLDAYSLDNVSVYNSVRRKGATLRASKRSYGNVAFDDPSLRHNALGTHELAKYVEKKSSIWEEFKEVPQIIARADEVPAGCEDKNRYANVIPLPETRVILQQQNGDEKSEYINANYVRGPKDTTNYYIACQAPLETTVTDFWRMIWEQNSRVIIMATDLMENGIEKCAEYLPPSVTLDNHTSFGEYQVTLKHREVKEKYAISTLTLKNTTTEESREITHYWYQWPEAGVPTDEAAIIAMLLEARSSLKLYAIEQDDNKIETIIAEDNVSQKVEINGNVNSEKQKPVPKDQGPLTIHCSPGTGRTGTILACDIAMRCLEEPKRIVDIPQIVYSVRRGRASAVQTKEQYEFIYQVTHMYATKISNINNDN